jgi:hypothetical protein
MLAVKAGRERCAVGRRFPAGRLHELGAPWWRVGAGIVIGPDLEEFHGEMAIAATVAVRSSIPG